jgi:tetratricopeptide (TPR) repeat protein
MVLTAQGRLPEARQTYREGLAIQRSIGEKRDIARTNTLLARVTIYEGRAKEAEAMARQAAEELHEQKLPEDEARALAAVTNAFVASRQLSSAADSIRRAVGLIRGGRSRVVGFDVGLAAAGLDAAHGRHEPAVARLTRLLAEATGFLEYEFAARLALGEIELASGRGGAGRARRENRREGAPPPPPRDSKPFRRTRQPKAFCWWRGSLPTHWRLFLVAVPARADACHFGSRPRGPLRQTSPEFP